jgi:hypothetical protein
VQASGGSFQSMTVTASAAASATPHGTGTNPCAARADGSAQALLGIRLTQPGFLLYTVKGTVKGYGAVVAGVEDGLLNSPPDGAIGGAGLTGQGEAFAPAQESLELVAGVSVSAYQNTSLGPRTAQGSGTISMRYVRLGAAKAAPSGMGKAYALLPAFVDCGNREVPVVFTRRAVSGAKAIALYRVTATVSGGTSTKLVKTIKKPQAGFAALVGGVSATADTTIRAVVTPKKGKKVTVTRSYVPCEG